MDAIPSNVGSVADIAKACVKAMGKQHPSAQEEQGADKLNQARDLVTRQVQSIPASEGNDVQVIEKKITQ